MAVVYEDYDQEQMLQECSTSSTIVIQTTNEQAITADIIPIPKCTYAYIFIVNKFIGQEQEQVLRAKIPNPNIHKPGIETIKIP